MNFPTHQAFVGKANPFSIGGGHQSAATGKMNRRQLSRTCTLEAVASVENLLRAATNARRGKSRRADVEDWWLRRESEVLRLREELLSGGYQPGS